MVRAASSLELVKGAEPRCLLVLEEANLLSTCPYPALLRAELDLRKSRLEE